MFKRECKIKFLFYIRLNENVPQQPPPADLEIGTPLPDSSKAPIPTYWQYNVVLL